MKRLLFGVVVLLAIGSVTTSANDDKKVSSTLVAAITKAADNQLARQATYTNADTGVGTMACAWEWQAGSGVANANTQSPSARGLLAAYGITNKAKYLKAARCAADQLVARLDASTIRPFSEDVIFLTEIAEASDNKAYAKRAAIYHKRTRAKYATGADLADHYIDERKSLAGWDLSSQIEAALAVDQEEYAQAIAERLVQRRADWEGVPYGGDYTALSRLSLVGALSSLEGKAIKQYRDEVRTSTMAAQAVDGSWGEGDYQTTAWALTGLSASPRSAKLKSATAAGIKYLLATQSGTTGGWVYEGWGESPEVNGEVLSALCLYAQSHGDDERDDR